MEIEFLVLSMGVLQFSKFHENGVDHDKRNFNRGLIVTFDVQILSNYRKNWLKVWQAYFFESK